jgi:hypothetical protein
MIRARAKIMECVSWKADGNAMEKSDEVNVVPWSPTKSFASKRSV